MLIKSKNIVLLSDFKQYQAKVADILFNIFNYREVFFTEINIDTVLQKAIDNCPDALFTGKLIFTFDKKVNLKDFLERSKSIEPIVDTLLQHKDFKMIYVTSMSSVQFKDEEDVINIFGLNDNDIFYLIANKFKNDINIYSPQKILSLFYLNKKISSLDNTLNL